MGQAEDVRDEGYALYGDDDAPAPDWDEGGEVDKIDVDWTRVKRCAEYDQNDRDNARRLIEWFGDDLAYVSGMGWLTWRGTHWERDEGDLKARFLAQEVVDKIKLEAFYLKLDRRKQSIVDEAKAYQKIIPAERSPEQEAVISRSTKILSGLYQTRSKRKTFAISSGNAGKTRAMLDQAASLKAIDQNLLDANHMLFNVRNGTLVFSKVEHDESDPDDPRYIARVEFRPHDRADMVTKRAEVDYDPDADCPFFKEQFLAKVQPDKAMQLFLQVFQAYSMLIGRNDEQKLAFHYGTGANGKSAFIEIFGRIAGTYRTVVSPETITGDGQRQGQQASPDIARLFNTRFVTVEELPKNAPLKEDLIKAVSGGTKMTARFLMQNIFEFEPIFTASLTGNTKPSIAGSDYGIWRRVLLVLWGVTIPEEERMAPSELNDRLDAERSGILNWMIEGIKLYMVEGLTPYIPPEVTAFTEDYRHERDNVSVFAESCLKPAPNQTVPAGVLYTVYCKWAEKNGLTAAKQRSFGDRLGELGYKKDRGRTYTYLDVYLDYEAMQDGAAPPPDPGDPGPSF
nr:phage/plasmid primase, P4 family [Pelagibacterium limicola]